MSNRLKIAVQKSGRLAEKSLSILTKSGLEFDFIKNHLVIECREFPADLMLMRDDDIPEYISNGICHLGIVGENILLEKNLSNSRKDLPPAEIVKRLGYGKCRLSIAVPQTMTYQGLRDLQGLRVATSYPYCLQSFLAKENITCQIIELNGSVEIAPRLSVADVVCDLVSTGSTLKTNGLREVATLFNSESVMIKTPKPLSEEVSKIADRLVERVTGVIRASQSKYIMMNAKREALKEICRIIPGIEEPSIMQLGNNPDRIAIHAVTQETVFWETIENLKAAGASSILVLSIEKVIP